MTEVTSYRTAIRRKVMSRPAHWIQAQGLIVGSTLDYGCGYGMDAKILKCESYDPHYFPILPTGLFDTILCTYVLNVLPLAEQGRVLEAICKLMAPAGHAYVTVRRDIKVPRTTKRGYQTPVYLDLSTIKDRREWTIYVLES